MHRVEFIISIMDGLGNQCSPAQAAMVFAYADANGLVNRDQDGNWSWTDEAREEYSRQTIDLGEIYRDAETAGYSPADYADAEEEIFPE